MKSLASELNMYQAQVGPVQRGGGWWLGGRAAEWGPLHVLCIDRGAASRRMLWHGLLACGIIAAP